jgi:hypothetical protein
VSCRATEEDEEEEGLLFIPQVIYEHEEPRRSDTDRIKLLIRPPELSGNHTRSHLVARRRNGRRE